MRIILLIICTLTLISCKSTNETDQKVEPTTEQVEANNVRFIVSFISKGSSIDYEAKTSFIGYVESNNIDFDAVSWGREGEIDYCLNLDELEPDKQTSIIEDIKQLLSSSDLVRYKEKSKCREMK